jgi:hypothetical protein
VAETVVLVRFKRALCVLLSGEQKNSVCLMMRATSLDPAFLLSGLINYFDQ